MRLPVDEVRDIDCRAVAERLGLELNRNGFARCVAHPDGGRPNMKVYDVGVRCYRCDFSADSIGLVQQVLDADFADAVKWLASEATEDMRVYKVPESVPSMSYADDRIAWQKFTDEAHRQIDREGLAWFRGRGITAHTVAAFGLGAVTRGNGASINGALRKYGVGGSASRYADRAIFPFRVRGRVEGFQARTMVNELPKYLGPGGHSLPLYNFDAMAEAGIAGNGNPLWFCEGPIDALVLSQTHRLAVGVPGVGSIRLSDLIGVDGLECVVCFDGDDAGRKGAKRMARRLSLAGAATTFIVELPEGTDAAEWDWQAGTPEMEEWERGREQ